ncbi:aminotransferase class I/II-fold pyridoxal phosphate-dependent enzyme [Euzebya sp.]|uniref:aminotransferase class I/II-fold pyridoxal phosphate-dependent enzyme n=1 Tax=Euzebya sp. TaxID=1971409 RepID=UPI003518677B
MTLSARGHAMADGGLSPYIAEHFARRHDPGYVGLCVAENHLVADLLIPRIESPPPVPDHVLAYDDMSGRADLRRALAGLLERHVVGRPVDPATVQVLSGAGGVLDALGHALGDPGDGVLVPTPSYSGFWPDLQARPGLEIVPVPTVPEEGYALTPERLDRAADGADVDVRILLLTNPDNPRGQVVPAADVEAVLDWADARGLHVIADEVYALSTFGETPFASVGRLRPSLGERLHLVWAFSKDFAMSGLRTGVVVSEHEPLRRALEVQGSWAGVSGHTQHVLAAMLHDDGWVEGYITTMRARLAAAAEAVSEALTSAGIPHTRPEAGFFTLCDLRQWLPDPTWEGEDRLWRQILDRTGVNLTPGSALRAPEPGFVRLCYASNPTDVVEDAIGRVGALLDS